MSLVNHLKKLAINYELVVYTILPRDTINQIYALIPNVHEIISHTLCYEDMFFEIFDGGFACKDISLLADNRSNCELIVVDVLDSQQSVDLNTVTYLTLSEYDGKVTYTNLDFLSKSLNDSEYNKDRNEEIMEEVMELEEYGTEESGKSVSKDSSDSSVKLDQDFFQVFE